MGGASCVTVALMNLLNLLYIILNFSRTLSSLFLT